MTFREQIKNKYSDKFDESYLTELCEKGFSEDGFIINQELFSGFIYRTIKSSLNGCGWIAVYNLLRILGVNKDFDEIRDEMNKMHVQIHGPTKLNVMLKTLDKYAPGYIFIEGKEDSSMEAESAKAGIFRYYEEGIPHFVMFYKTEKSFRFFNVNDDMWDFEEDIKEFTEKHFKGGSVRLICYK